MNIYSVYAEDLYDSTRIGAYSLVRSLLGGVVGFVDGSVDTAYDVYEICKDFTDKVLNYNSDDDTFTLPTDGNGNVMISQDFYNSLKNALNNGIYRLDGYYLIEKKTTFNDWVYNVCKPKYNLSERTISSLHDTLLNYQEPYFYGSNGGSMRVIKGLSPSILSSGKYCFYIGSYDYFSFAYISDTGSIVHNYLTIGDMNFHEDSFAGPSTGTKYKFQDMFGGGYLPSATFQLFYNKSAAERYLQGNRHYVPKVKIPPGGLKIPVEVINNNVIGDTITNNITSIDTTGLTQEEIQVLIDTAVNETINQYTFGTPTATPSSTPLPPVTDTPTPTPSPGSSYDYDELSRFLTNLWERSDKRLDDVIKLLEENNSYQKKLLSSLNDIKALLVVDTIMDTFKDRSSETANKAKEKFPLSIPWDVAMVVNTMCAEPKTPVIRCPIVINSLHIKEEIVIDLTDDEWEKLAKTCRSLLSITFVLYLTHLTRKIFSNGGDD